MELLLKVLLQTSLAFFTILVITRVLGKQQLAQLTYYEYINGITFGSIAATMATDTEQEMWQHFAGLMVFGVLTFLMSYFSLKSRPVRKIITGEPVIVIQKGNILENNLKKMRLNMDEFISELRSKGVFNIGDVEFAIIEPSGKLSLLKTSDTDSPTRGDLGIKAVDRGLPVEIIVDGQLIYSNLRLMGLDGQWLRNKITQNGIKSLKKIAYASIDKQHNIYFDLYDDNIEGMIDISDDEKIPYTLDTLKIGDKDKKS